MDSSRSPKRALLTGAAVVFLLVAGLLATWFFALTSPESRRVGAILADHLARVEAGHSLHAEIEIVEVEGLPDELEGQRARLTWRSPDCLRIATTVAGEDLAAGRVGDEIWIHLPGKEFAVIGDNATPRFTGDPGSARPVDLPDFSVPITGLQRLALPALLEVSRLEEGGEIRHVVTPSPLARNRFDLPEFEIVFTAVEGESQTYEVVLPGGKNVALALVSLEFQHFFDPSEWQLPTEASPVAERVALSHLVRFLDVAPRALGSKTPTLPPATGTRELVATSGQGRLEMQDGVRVLHLAGTPEEMGRQQGDLLRDEVHAVVDRILYGVGVGTSFEKGRWFFGEIEEAQSRVEPFTSEAHLREMDALADAAGLHRQEARLSNFFPELFHCSGFAVHGAATKDGTLYHGRILDYMIGVGLESNAVVTVCRPEGLNAWVNLTYAGFIGSVTAMNEKHVAIGEMGGRGEGNWDGTPMAQLVRDVMEQCDTIDEAVELMRSRPRTCEYYYVISDGKDNRAVGIEATPEIFRTIWSGESHPRLPTPVEDTVLMSSDDRYRELVRRVKDNYGNFDADSARDLMTRPVCMKSNIQSVLFAPASLDFWIANADGENVASHTRYTRFNLRKLLDSGEAGKTELSAR